MASLISNGSPVLSKKPSAHFVVLDQNTEPQPAMASSGQPTHGTANPLQTSRLGNLQPPPEDTSKKAPPSDPKTVSPSAMDNILARLRANDISSNGSRAVSNPAVTQHLANPNEQRAILKKQKSDIGQQKTSNEESKSSSASDTFTTTPTTGLSDKANVITKNNRDSDRIDAAEMLRVKQELAAAKSVINRQEQELAETRNLKHTMEQAMGTPSESDFGNNQHMNDPTIGHLQSAFNATARPFTTRNNTWFPLEEARPDNTDGFPTGAFDRARHVPMFNNATNNQLGFGPGFTPSIPQVAPFGDPRLDQPGNSNWSNGYGNQGLLNQPPPMTPAHRLFSGPAMPTFSLDNRLTNDNNNVGQGHGYRRAISQFSRPSTGFDSRSSAFGNMATPLSSIATPQMTTMGYPGAGGYQPRPSGPNLSPTASEFSFASVNPNAGPGWSSMTNNNGQTYVTPLEPMNYRRLLDKSITCDWKYIVDKIVCNNDQQASIFLQQKLKVGTAEQKFEIVEAIVNQAYPLMINRFGNFLVQRCFEHGTPDQVVAIANAIHGNVLPLSMDPFGCHVIQKAFDSVPENHKSEMVRELLRRIPDTVIHRYACHVWQKLFELRWNGEPPQIMSKVNEALRDMWHEVALGETGSLVVQNIFENCIEEEKRPAIEEVITNIDLIAHGQFGNWCIQHLCEHAAPADKRRVIDHILANSYSYSIDQFASKVVEKCLKIGGSEFLERYLGVITTAHPERPRIPLIDIAGDQYGNYLIQWILMNAQYHQREQVAIHIRKHMVSLRGSKFGSRVAMLCCNPAQVTRPGPGVIVNPFGAPGQPRGWGRFR